MALHFLMGRADSPFHAEPVHEVLRVAKENCSGPTCSLVHVNLPEQRGATMAAAPTVHKLQTKSQDKADEVRTPDKTRVEVVKFDDFTIGRFIPQPGWRWSQCVKP